MSTLPQPCHNVGSVDIPLETQVAPELAVTFQENYSGIMMDSEEVIRVH